MEYRPLKPDGSEVRIIRLFTKADGPQYASGAVHCALEQVSLQTFAEGHSSHPPGDLRVPPRTWLPLSAEHIELEPRIRQNAATNVLWNAKELPKANAHADTQTQDNQSTSRENEGHLSVEDKFEWRFPWGDYMALSYVWGDPSKKKEIFVNGRSVQVTANLEAALQALRDFPRIIQGFRLWIDALCINQDDLVERSVQVGNMRNIYASAWQVVIWLGPESQGSDLAMVAIKWLSQRVRCERWVDGFYRETKPIDLRPLVVMWSKYVSPMRDEVYTALHHLFCRPYWRRLWILQEIALGSSNSPVICGNKCVTWEDISNAADLIQRDEHRFGRAILESIESDTMGRFEWDFSSDRLPGGHEPRTSAERLWKLLLKIAELQRTQDPDAPVEWPDIFSALRVSQGAQATDPKDKIYGMLGLRSIASFAHITPDYSLDLSEVYQSFSKNLYSEGNMSAIRLVPSPIGNITGSRVGKILPEKMRSRYLAPLTGLVHPGCPHRMPTWAICWACPKAPTCDLVGNHSASGDHKAQPTFDAIGMRMHVQGIFLDRVKSLTSFHCYEEDQTYPESFSGISSAYGNLAATRTAFWNTIVAGTTREGLKAPESYALLLNPQLWQDSIAGAKTYSFGLDNFMRRNKAFLMFDRTLQDFIIESTSFLQRLAHPSTNGRVYNPTALQREAVSWAINVLAWRRMVITEKGYLGLAPADSRQGDRIYVVLGCNMPVVLRKCGDFYTVVGESYLHGFMDGEAILNVRDESLQVEELRIC